MITRRRLYVRWCNMKYRCTDPRRPDYARYGGRGIWVCAEWLKSFDAFEADVGYPPSPQHTLDRIDNNGGYEPRNVRWATRSEQNRNQRPHYNPYRDAAKSRGSENFHAKITESVVLAIRERRAAGESPKSIADDYGIHERSVSDIVVGKTWKHVGGPTRKYKQPRDWNGADDARVLAHTVADETLSQEINRSLSAIRGRRFKLRQASTETPAPAEARTGRRQDRWTRRRDQSDRVSPGRA